MDRNETRLHERPAELAGQQAAQPAASAAAGGATAPAQGSTPGTTGQTAQSVHAQQLPAGEFHPYTQRRQHGLASRSWIPVALSFGTALLTAIALVIYFSQHT